MVSQFQEHLNFIDFVVTFVKLESEDGALSAQTRGLCAAGLNDCERFVPNTHLGSRGLPYKLMHYAQSLNVFPTLVRAAS
jgi:hypothetical protein